jgi:16S rRNA (cytosine967-C5)-methyltransferase
LNARRVAADTLTAARTADAWVGDVLDRHVTDSGLSPADRRLVTQIVLGVVRRRATLDAVLRPHVSRPFHEVQQPLVDLLRVGAYQLLFLTQVPPHAAVHETVSATLGPARGFVNAVLRRVADAVTADYGREPAADAVPLDDRHRYRRLAKPLLPDPAAEPAKYLAAAFSWPRWLADRWLGRHGFAECCRLGFWFNAPPPLWLRVNKTQLPREAYRLALQAAGIDAEPGPHPQSLRLPDPPPVRHLPGYDAGEFCVQDLTSQAVAAAVAPQPGWRVLDLCGAPGGKATHLAELMGDRGEVVACDVDPGRLATVTTLCQRLRLTCVTPHLLDRRDPRPPPGPLQAALVDAPCSNTGVLGRRPEARWRLHPSEFPDLIRLQTRLLLTAVERVRPGGVVVYSTCSVEPDENGGVVAAVRQAIRGLRLEAEHTSAPGRPADGGYWARLRLPG